MPKFVARDPSKLLNTSAMGMRMLVFIRICLHLCSASSSDLKVNNRSFNHASPYLCNHLPKELRQHADHEYLSLSSDFTHISSPFSSSPPSPSITPSLFHSRLKTHLFHKSFLHTSSTSHPTDWLHGFQLFFVFSGMSVLTLVLCAKLASSQLLSAH